MNTNFRKTVGLIEGYGKNSHTTTDEDRRGYLMHKLPQEKQPEKGCCIRRNPIKGIERM